MWPKHLLMMSSGWYYFHDIGDDHNPIGNLDQPKLGFHSHGGAPIAGWFLRDNHHVKWMMTGGTSIYGNPQWSEAWQMGETTRYSHTYSHGHGCFPPVLCGFWMLPLNGSIQIPQQIVGSVGLWLVVGIQAKISINGFAELLCINKIGP